MIKADVEAVDKECDVALVFVLSVRKRGEPIGDSCEEGAEPCGRYLPQFLMLFSGPLSLTKKVRPLTFRPMPVPPLSRSLISQYFGILVLSNSNSPY